MDILPYFDFTNIKDKIKEFDFILFYNDDTKIDDDSIIDYSNFIIKNKLDQLILNNLDNNLNISKMIEYDYYEKIIKLNKIFKNLKLEEIIQKNYSSNYKSLDYTLQPSIIRTKKFFLSESTLKRNPHIENLYWKELINKGFNISPYFSNNIINKNKITEIFEKDTDNFSISRNNINKNTKKYYKFLKIYLNKIEYPIFNNKSGDNLTIVTGFLNIKIKRPPKSDTPHQKYDYLDKSRDTLKIPQYMIIYCSEELIEKVSEIRKELGLLDKTKIIKITIENNLYMYDQLDKVRDNVKKNNSPYDIAEYILAVNSRYGYIEDAIKNNYFNTDYFAWVDFSASHIVDIPDNRKITYSSHEKIRIGWIARYSNDNFVYNHHCLGGGIFVGYKEIMLELIKLHHKEFVKLMEMGYNINDDKLLFIIMEQNPHLFDTYFSGYSNLFIRL